MCVGGGGGHRKRAGWAGELAFLLLTGRPASSGASSLHVLSSQSLGRVGVPAIPILQTWRPSRGMGGFRDHTATKLHSGFEPRSARLFPTCHSVQAGSFSQGGGLKTRLRLPHGGQRAGREALGQAADQLGFQGLRFLGNGSKPVAWPTREPS